MSNNKILNRAKKEKNDEFYTRIEDVENEMSHYEEQLKNKAVYCNCDDTQSAFWRFFRDNFKKLKLKKIICSHIEKDGKYSEATIYDGYSEQKIQIHCDDKYKVGDFRSSDCLKLLEDVDVVITNPPFSLFREYVAQLMEYEKKFLIIGNMNAITYKEIFPLLKENLVWLGYTHPKIFLQPDGSEKSFGNIRWYTNLGIKKRHEKLDLRGNYFDPEVNPKYDNYDAIEVSKVNDIPCDYDGAMGVPITFLDKYCPEQFEIIGSFSNSNIEKKTEDYYVLSKNTPTMINGQEKLWNGPVVSKKPLYKRIVIRRK